MVFFSTLSDRGEKCIIFLNINNFNLFYYIKKLIYRLDSNNEKLYSHYFNINMLNIFLIKSKKNDELLDNRQTSLSVISLNKDVSSKNTIRGDTRHYLPATKEWLNSIYTYNVNYMKSLAITDNVVNKIIKSYFFLRLVYMKNIFKGMSKRQRLLSVNRIFVSKAEMKHTNNKVIITLYTYNKEKNYFLRKLTSLRNMLIFRNNYLFLINLKKKAILKNIYIVSFLIYNILKKKDLLNYYENNKQIFEDLIKKNKFIIGEKHEKFFEKFNDNIQ